MAYLTKIKTRLAIHAHRKVSGLLDGQYASLQSGRSLDFADLREYVIGDDVKDIDWKATARHSKPLIKRYVADRKHTVVLAVTTGQDMAAYANPNERKVDVLLNAAGLLGYVALSHGDYVGLYATNGDKIEAARPSTREVNVERMLGKVDQMCTLDAPQADLGALLEFAVGATRRRNIILLVIDDIDFTLPIEGLLRRLVAQHEVLLMTIGDLDPTTVIADGSQIMQLDRALPVPDFVTGDERLTAELAEADEDRRRRRADICQRLGVPYEHVSSSDDVIGVIIRLLERAKYAGRR